MKNRSRVRKAPYVYYRKDGFYHVSLKKGGVLYALGRFRSFVNACIAFNVEIGSHGGLTSLKFGPARIKKLRSASKTLSDYEKFLSSLKD